MEQDFEKTRDWKPLIDNLEQRRDFALAMGGDEKVTRHNIGGRLDARGRIAELVDEGTFRELGTFAGGNPGGMEAPCAADAFVAGMARIDGRPVLVGSEDFTSRGGSIGLGNSSKRYRLVRLAEQERVPLVIMLEGAGERTTNQLGRSRSAGNDLQALADISGKVPTVGVVMGPSAGHGALTAMLMDLIIMVEGASIFSAGPPLVASATGEKVTKEELGGTHVHIHQSGVAHNMAPDERAALALVRRYLGYMPLNAWERPVRMDSTDGERRLDDILELIPPQPNRAYDARKLVDMVADEGSVLEIQPHFGCAMITALVRIGGRSTAVLANQPLVRSGAIDCDAANKAAHFLEIADAFHLPVVFLADNPGVMAGTDAERSGALRCAARMYSAQRKVRSAKISVTVRKAYGFGSSVMAMNPFDHQTLSIAFPGATLGAMPAAGGGQASGADADTQAALDAAETGGPWKSADTMGYDEVIDPRDLRNVLLSALELSSGRESGSVEPRWGGIRP